MAPSVHPSGPSGAYTIAGAMSFESLYMVNGVTANENVRGQPTTFNLYIEDAIQETVVATDGVSAEYGRFSGGLVNIITKSGGNSFHGSFRDTLNNDDWRALVVGNGNFAPLAAGQTDGTVQPSLPASGEHRFRIRTALPVTPRRTKSSRPTSTCSAGQS